MRRINVQRDQTPLLHFLQVDFLKYLFIWLHRDLVVACEIQPQNQGSNLCPLPCKWILSHWTTKEVPPCFLKFIAQSTDKEMHIQEEGPCLGRRGNLGTQDSGSEHPRPSSPAEPNNCLRTLLLFNSLNLLSGSHSGQANVPGLARTEKRRENALGLCRLSRVVNKYLARGP